MPRQAPCKRAADTHELQAPPDSQPQKAGTSLCRPGGCGVAVRACRWAPCRLFHVLGAHGLAHRRHRAPGAHGLPRHRLHGLRGPRWHRRRMPNAMAMQQRQTTNRRRTHWTTICRKSPKSPSCQSCLPCLPWPERRPVRGAGWQRWPPRPCEVCTWCGSLKRGFRGGLCVNFSHTRRHYMREIFPLQCFCVIFSHERVILRPWIALAPRPRDPRLLSSAPCAKFCARWCGSCCRKALPIPTSQNC